MRKNNELIVSLCGGLGNQLFQVSHALAFTQRNILLENNFGHPRRNEEGVPEILSFSQPKRIGSFDFGNPPSFLTRVASYLLRSRSNPNKVESNRIYKLVIKWICTVLFTLYFKRMIRIVDAEGIGVKHFKVDTARNLQVGYFQSYLTTEEDKVFTEMQRMVPNSISYGASELLEESSKKRILVVHVRLGDYKSEQDFGMPGDQYYKSAIKLALQTKEFTDIWIFSDEIALAKKRLRISSQLPIRWIGDENLSTAETFEIMKSGKGFVIANSSFSWWAARLSYSTESLVITPNPWFKNLKEPDNLVPPHWLRLNAHYE